MDLFVHFANSLHNPCLPKFAEAVCRRSFEGSKANVSGQDDVMRVEKVGVMMNDVLFGDICERL